MKSKSIIFLFLWAIIPFSFSQSSSQEKELQFAEVKRPYMTTSPMIEKLLSLDGKELDKAVKGVWRRAKKEGLPIIEIDTLDDDYSYLTMIYQNNAEKWQVSFEIKGLYAENRLGNLKLRRLGKTDLYYRCYKVPKDICFSYRFILKDSISGLEFHKIDPYNSDIIPRDKIYKYTYSVLDLKKENSDWKSKKKLRHKSQLDTLKYTDGIVNKSRNIYVYLPPKYDKNRAEPYPVIYLFDAFLYLHRVEAPVILDHLIATEKIKPMIAVFFGTYRDSRRILLPLNFDFKEEFTSEVLSLVKSKYHVSPSPQENIIGGMSYGGLAGAFIAFYHPEIFGKVLSQSGSFWRGTELNNIHKQEIRKDWLIEKFQLEDKKDLKLFLDWGLQENWVLGSNRRMVKALEKKGYDYRFVEFNGWHDWANTRKTFAGGLMYLLEDVKE